MDFFEYIKNKGINLTEQQKVAATSIERNTLLLAVPGSGKTTVLTARIAYLLQRGIPASKILTLTFSKESANDMEKRFDTVFGETVKAKPKFSTIHSFCYSILHYYATVYNRKMPNIIGENGTIGKKAVLGSLFHKYNGKRYTDDEIEKIDNAICFAKNNGSKSKYATDDAVAHFDEILKDYDSYKKENNLIDYDDMLSFALDILKKRTDIKKHYINKYNFINVDEAQDTSPLQHKIIFEISEKSIIFMVGDEDQSIYTFRGANPSELLEFNKRYSNTNVLKLEENFRSDKNLVEATNNFIKQNKKRYDKSMFSSNVFEDSKISIENIADFSMQYKTAVEIACGLPHNEKTAILYRENISAVPLAMFLNKYKMPFYIKKSGVRSLTNNTVRDIIEYMHLGYNMSDIDAFSKIYYKLGYSKALFDYASDNASHYDDIFACLLTVASMKNFMKIKTRQYRSDFRVLWSLPPAEAIDFINNELGYNKFTEHSSSSVGKIKTVINLAVVRAFAENFKDNVGFLSHLYDLSPYVSPPSSEEHYNTNITLSTYHSVKGLEFDNVILMDTIKDFFPSYDSQSEARLGNTSLLEDEVRLFYVGVTRAKKRIFMFSSNKLLKASAHPSDFVLDFAEKRYNVICQVGETIIHKYFGRGRVNSLIGEIANVFFYAEGEKKINITACNEKGLIKIIKEDK